MRMYDIIDKKRHLGELTYEELNFAVTGYTKGEIPDYQISALLMAVCFAGMSDSETAALTQIMQASGDTLDLSPFGAYTVDKHSTGGVGDKTTLIISPIVASLGCTVAKLSGRGLGHTGGTIDKLESINGFKTNLSPEEFVSIAKECGICVSGAAANLVPADKKLYALRDVTATVNSIPLIVSSIMSKKLAGGANSIVLDVKTGSGAFMKTLSDSKELASRMVSIGKLSGRKTAAVITNMDRPLGKNIGNALEVKEASDFLKGSYRHPDLYSVCITLAAQMVSLSENIDYNAALNSVNEVLDNGKAYNKFLQWISLQGGDVSQLDEPSYTKAEYNTQVLAPADGYLDCRNAEKMGIAAMHLGAGRAKKEDTIDMQAGIIRLASIGDYVNKGDPIAILQSNTVADHSSAQTLLLESHTFSRTPVTPQPTVYEIIK